MTNTTSLIENTASKTVAANDSASTARIVKLPARFDVHQIESFMADVTKDAARLVTTTFDGAAVEMIDMAALRSLAGVAAEFPELTIVRPSVALRATINCTGHDKLSERLILAGTPAPALTTRPALFAQAA